MLLNDTQPACASIPRAKYRLLTTMLFAALALVTAVVVLYAATATRAMADPQPGSSTSSQAGASFTL